jgi:hypothetical protein
MSYKCATCGKAIQNPYYLDGKIYGHECYKLAVALKYAHLQEMKNDDYTKKCISSIETFRNKIFKDKWNQDFQKSVLTQWDSCNKLTAKQFDVIVKKFDEIENINYKFLYLELLEDIEKIAEIQKELFNTITRTYLKQFKGDERFLSLANKHYERSKKRGIRHFITELKDIDEEQSWMQILQEIELESYKNKDYIEILTCIEV